MEKKKIESFEDLDCWVAGSEVKKMIANIIKTLPASEKFDLIDNMRRAARSVTRNIAEGYGRFHYKENIQFCRISRGSLTELIDDLITCRDEKYISETEYSDVRQKIQTALNILNGYINYLIRAADQKNKKDDLLTNNN